MMRVLLINIIGFSYLSVNELSKEQIIALINGIHTSENKGLIVDILKCEFGHNGLIMTDWNVSHGFFVENKPSITYYIYMVFIFYLAGGHYAGSI